MAIAILLIGLIFFVAHGFSLVFERISVPDVLMLTLVGIVLGPFLGLIRPEDFGDVGRVMATVALVVILFEGGMALNLTGLQGSFARVAPLFLGTFAGTILFVSLLGLFVLGLPALSAVAFGAILGSITPIVVLPLARSLKLSNPVQSALIIESSLTDVFSIILVFELTQAATGGSIDVGHMIGKLLSALLFAAVIGFVGSILWLKVLEFIRRLPNSIILSIAFLFVVYGLAEFLGYSGAIAALAFGLGLANRPFGFLGRLGMHFHENVASITETEKSFFGEVVFILKTFFFLYLGISIRFADLSVFEIAGGITAGIYVVRLAACRVFGDRSMARRDISIVASLAPKGLASAAMAGLPLAAGMAGGQRIQEMTFLVVFLSITLSALLVFLLERGGLRRGYEAIFRSFGTGQAAETEQLPEQP